MTRSVSVAELVAALGDDDELALVDAREQGAYSGAHLLFAANLPRSRVELRAPLLIPRRSARVVVTDAGGGEAADVATTLGGLPLTVSFPGLHFEPVLVPEAENSLPMPVLLPIDAQCRS